MKKFVITSKLSEYNEHYNIFVCKQQQVKLSIILHTNYLETIIKISNYPKLTTLNKVVLQYIEM